MSSNKEQPLIDTISENYAILKVLGAGCYGQVVECLKLDTDEIVAVKVLIQLNSKKNNMREILSLERLRGLDPDKSNIVRCHEWFQNMDRTFIVFEMLDMSLHDYMNSKGRLPLPLNGIRMVIKDLATALDTLKGIGIIHTDIKLDNVMLKDHHLQPFSVKLIDFGLAVKTSEVWPGAVVQPLWNRSPEVLLGLPFNEAIDTWSLGTVMAEMLLGFPLFPGRNEYDVLRYIIDLLGKPPKELLNIALNTALYFKEISKKMHWTFMTPNEYQSKTMQKAKEYREYRFCSLESLKKTRWIKKNSPASEDRAACVELLQEILQVDQKERITPAQILTHPFTTRSYLSPKNVPVLSLPFVIELRQDERTIKLEEISALSTESVQGNKSKVEIEQYLILESITDEDWEMKITEEVRANDSTEDPISSSEESLPSPVVSELRKKKGIRGFFSKMKRKFSCFHGMVGCSEAEQEFKLESITDQDWEIEIIKILRVSDSTKDPISSSEESLPSPVVSEPRKKKGIRGFFSKMKRKFFPCLKGLAGW
ncbi:homeodomain-interacting protein kinase 3-like [Eleginops maclovinus]|uniref:homeodomain-interacting protein kinase 3-like n=1 Tax=Eleginops maclovinus TaxID=56733 RepID=UPI00307FF5BC